MYFVGSTNNIYNTHNMLVAQLFANNYRFLCVTHTQKTTPDITILQLLQ